MEKSEIMNCGLGTFKDLNTGKRFEKTASGDLKEVDDGISGKLERLFVQEQLENSKNHK